LRNQAVEPEKKALNQTKIPKKIYFRINKDAFTHQAILAALC